MQTIENLENMMTENLPTLEEMIPAEELEALKAKIAKTYAEGYQPFLDKTIELAPLTLASPAHLECDVNLRLAVEDGKTVLHNSVVARVVFTPEVTYDMFEEVNRTIIRELFAKVLNRANLT